MLLYTTFQRNLYVVLVWFGGDFVGRKLDFNLQKYGNLKFALYAINKSIIYDGSLITRGKFALYKHCKQTVKCNCT